MKKDSLAEIVKTDKENSLIKAFRLTTSLPLTQLVCFDHNNKIRKYKDELEILEEFYGLRLELYRRRKEYMLRDYNRELAIIDNKVRFILSVIEGKIVINRQKRKTLVNKLFEMKFVPYSKFGSAREESLEEKVLVASNENVEQPAEEVKAVHVDEDKDMVVPAKEYDYLLKMFLWSLTYERIEELLAEKAKY